MVKTIKLKIGVGEYTVSFPTVGQVLDIESLKSALTNGTYGDMVKMGTKTSIKALDLADTIATFSVLIPNFNKIMDVKTYNELDQFTAKMIVEAYRDQFFPWFNEINEELQKFGDEK